MSVEFLIVDRIEGDFAICEKDGGIINIPMSKIVDIVREGDVLRENKQNSTYFVDAEAVDERRVAMTKRFERIKARKTK